MNFSTAIGNPPSAVRAFGGACYLELFLINRQGDLFHFLNFRDHDSMSPGSLKHNPARPHVFADERHQFLPLIRVRHFGRDGEIQPTIGDLMNCQGGQA
jgi:hypothetical protein